MNTVVLHAGDLAVSASLVEFDAVLSMVLRLDIHRQVLRAASRMIVQLVTAGYLLHFVFAFERPALTLAIIVVMAAVAARAIVARPGTRIAGAGRYLIAGSGVAVGTVVTVGLALANGYQAAAMVRSKICDPAGRHCAWVCPQRR